LTFFDLSGLQRANAADYLSNPLFFSDFHRFSFSRIRAKKRILSTRAADSENIRIFAIWVLLFSISVIQ